MTTSSRAWRVFLRRMHGMSFADIFHKSNSSFSPLRGKTVECTVRPLQNNMVSVDTGLKAPIVCFQDELGTRVTEKTKVSFGIDRVESFGEPRMLLPKDLERRNSVKEVWTELEKIWRSDKNLVKGFVMNRVNGGYAVGVAGYIAFVPRSLLGSKRIFPHNPWKTFSILNMNPKIGNIVVREAPRFGFRPAPRTWLPTWNDSRPRSRGPSLAAPGFTRASLPSWNDGKPRSRDPDFPAPGFKQTSLPSWNDGRLKGKGSESPVPGSASSRWKDQTRQPFRRPQQPGKSWRSFQAGPGRDLDYDVLGGGRSKSLFHGVDGREHLNMLLMCAFEKGSGPVEQQDSAWCDARNCNTSPGCVVLWMIRYLRMTMRGNHSQTTETCARREDWCVFLVLHWSKRIVYCESDFQQHHSVRPVAGRSSLWFSLGTSYSWLLNGARS